MPIVRQRVACPNRIRPPAQLVGKPAATCVEAETVDSSGRFCCILHHKLAFRLISSTLPAFTNCRSALFRSSFHQPPIFVDVCCGLHVLVSPLLRAATVRHVRDVDCSSSSCAVLMALHAPPAMAPHGSPASLHASPCFRRAVRPSTC